MTDTPGPHDSGTRIECQNSDSFNRWLAALPGSLAMTTYQAGKVAMIGWRDNQPWMLMRQFDKPMGLAVQPGRLALATRHDITLFANAPLLARDLIHNQPGRYDALYLPRATYHTGDVNVHDVAFGSEGLWFVNSRFSCLSSLSKDFSFVPRWQPSFISDIVPEDRCHLNGLALVDGQPRYVTALGETNVVGGWRENKAAGGVLIDVATNSVVLRNLSMPHSPRWHQNSLYLLNSGAGELLKFAPATGTASVVCTLPAYLRGLCLIGHYAVVGMCQIREKHIFGGLPVQGRFDKLHCGLAVVDVRNGQVIGTFEFTSGCTELYDVQFLPGSRTPTVLNSADDTTRQAFTAPAFSYWLRPENVLRDESTPKPASDLR